MSTPSEAPVVSLHGLVAMLDALGAKTFSKTEVEQFLKSRQLILDIFHQVSHAKAIEERVKVFVFNDTVVIVLLSDRRRLGVDDVERFFILLRRFMLDSLQHRILFRGAVSIGDFYEVDDQANTVMGPAVTDAAEWYSRTDWFGINATPHASIFIDSLLDGSVAPANLQHLIVDYSVPMRDGPPLKLKAVNWPKSFYVEGMRPAGHGSGRRIFLSLLNPYVKPKGTESKYQHSIDFFDWVVKEQKLRQKQETRAKKTNAAPGATS